MRDIATIYQDKRRRITLLRGMVIVAVGALLVDAGGPGAHVASLCLVLAFAASNAAIPFIPRRLANVARFEFVIGALDLFLVGLGIQLAGASPGALTVSCLLMILIVALATYRAHAVAGVAAVGALHAWVVLSMVPIAEAPHRIVLQTIFLCAVGLYYGTMTEGIRVHRRREDADHLDHRELTTLLEILEAITSSLDLREVTLGIVSRITRIVPAVRCSILYINKSMTRCSVLASHDAPDLEELELDLDNYPEIRHAIETRNPVIIQDILNSPLLASVRDRLVELEFQSIVVIPLTFGQDLLGTLCLKTARVDQGFTAREIKFCTAVACASSNALKNAMLHRQAVEEWGHHRNTGEKLGRILYHSPDLILTTDTRGLITEFNRGAEQLLGYRKEDLLGQSCRALLAREETTLISRVCSSGAIANHACRLRKKDGSEVEMELNLSVLKNDAEETTGTVWVGRDVTELKAAHQQLLQAEKLSTIGEVISGVAHELNNPLCAVLGFSQLLLSRHAGSPLSRELEKINESALRCQQIVRNLLSFARGHKPERKYLGINGIIEKALDLKTYQLQVNNIRLRLELEPELPRTMLDFHQMQQVFLNLINNAQHAMRSRRDTAGELVVRTHHAEGIIHVEFSDEGEGMAPDVLQRIFDPFFTTKEQGEGTGLGLSVSYGIIKEHGGRIHATSRPGEGSTFYVDLPVRLEEHLGGTESPAIARVASPATQEGSHILVVDDEPLVLDLLIDVLEDAGHKVDTAANGNEACRKLRVRGYDLVISDIRMPQMNGIDFYRNLRTLRPELEHRIVFITGDLIDPETVQFLATVNARTLPKPLDISRIVEVVQETLDAHRDRSVA